MDLSVVIVNWKAREYLPGCLDSLLKNVAAIDSEVFFIDNNSMDGSPAWIRGRYPGVLVIENKENTGFSRASNQAIRLSRGDMILLLNPDTRLEAGAVGALISRLCKDSGAGITGPRIEYPDGRIYPQCKRSIPDIRKSFFYLFGLDKLKRDHMPGGRYTLDHLDPDKVHEVGAVSGSCMLIRREVFEDIGLLDEEFFLYGEDLDFCYRAGNNGWKVIYCPEARIVHYHGRSSRKRRLSSTVEFYRAMRTFYRKHYAPHRHPAVNGLVNAGIGLRMLLSLITMPLRPGRRAG